jgi:hypothetical protein
VTAAVSFGTLLDFQAAFWQPDLVSRPLNLPPGRIEDFSGGLLSDPGIQNFEQTSNRFRYNQGIQTRYPGVAVLPYVLKNQDSVTNDVDISGYNALGIRAHGIVSTVGGTRYLVGLGTKFYRADTTTGAMAVASINVDGAGSATTFGGNVTCVAQGLVGGTQSLLVALEGANGILYTTDATASPIIFTTLKTTTANDWIAAMRYFPTVGPGAWAIVGTLDGQAGVFSELGSTVAGSWDPQQASLAEFADVMPTAPVSFTVPTSPATGANNAADGTIAWNNPTNITASDDADADATMNSGVSSQWLVASDFTFVGPAAGDQIVGILVEIERESSTGAYDHQVQLRLNGVQVGITKYVQSQGSSTDTYKAFGAFDDTWFAELTGADLANLEVWYRAISGSASDTMTVDHIRVAAAYRAVSIGRVIKTNRQPFAARQTDLAITPNARWSNPEAVLQSDGVTALFLPPGSVNDMTSDYLIIGPFFAPAELAENLAVTGIQVDIERTGGGVTNPEDLVVQLFVNGALVGVNQAALGVEWNYGLGTTEYIKSFGRAGSTWGVENISGSDMDQVYVAVRVMADDTGATNEVHIDAVTMSIDGLVPGQTTSFDGGDLGGIGSAGFGSVRNGWMVSPSPTDPEGLTLVAAGDMFRLSFDWDVDSGRMTYDFTKPNTGLAYVHHAQPYLGGYIVTGGNAIGVGDQVKVVGSNGDVVPWNFPLYHGDEEVRVNSIMVQGLWSVMDVLDADAGDRQFWMVNDQARYYPDTILQSLSENEAGTGRSSIAATPIAWSTQPIYGPLNTIYSVFPNGTDTAWGRQFLPPDLSSNPVTTNASEVRSMAFDVDGVENTALYIETPDWDYGPAEANKTMNTLRHNDRLVSADASTYGTVVGSMATDGGTSFTALNTFNEAFERHRLATSGTAFRSFVLRLSLTHAAGTAKSPDALPWVFEADVQMPALRHWTALVKPESVEPNIIAFMQAVSDLMDSKTTQRLKVSTVRDGINTGAQFGAVATIDSLSWTAPFTGPELEKEPRDFNGSRGPVYMLIGFAERIGTVT